jgi:hypothetical protein
MLIDPCRKVRGDADRQHATTLVCLDVGPTAYQASVVAYERDAAFAGMTH